MSKQKKAKQQERQVLTGLERLGLRVSAMIGSPKAQFERRATIHQMDTDEEADWDCMMELLAETGGLGLTFNDDGTVTVTWEQPEDEAPPGEGVAEVEEEVAF